MEAIVLDEGGRTVSRQHIFDYFQQHKSLDERRDFLENVYTDTYVEILVDGVRVGYQGQDDGLLMWVGSYLSRTAESVFSWSVVADLTENLMERGEYKIKLGLQNAPVVAEQMTLFGMGEQMPVYEPDEAAPPLFPAQEVPQAVTDKALYTAGNESGSASRVAAFYMREHPEKENVLFLCREFGAENGRGIEHEGRKYAVWFIDDGIHLAQSSSVRSGYSRTTVTWEQASVRILELLNAGTYLSQTELEQVPDKALHEMANALIFTARDLTEEGRAQGLLAQTLAVYDEHRAFPDCTNALADQAKDKSFITQLAQEYHRFLFAYESDRSVLRSRLSEYNTHRIGIVLNSLVYDERHFEAKPDFLRQCKMFITQDEIDRFFLSGDVNSRLAVYAHFCGTHTPQEHQEFIKDNFGEYSGGTQDGYDFTKTRKGLTYKREYEWKTYDSAQLTIPNVVKEYQTLLAQKRFPGEDAIAAIPQYEKERLARTVYFAFSGLNGDVPRPYPENADFYGAVPAIQTQLTDPEQVQTMRETLTAALDALPENDRYYDCVKNAKEQLSALEDGSFSLFNHRHEGLAAQLPRTLPVEPESSAGPKELEPPVPEPEIPEPILPPVPRQRERADATEPLYRNGINYRITDNALGAGMPSERFANNLAAIRLLKTIEQENRTATAEEQGTLAKYVGWGGLADCFDENNSHYAELKALLSDTEYEAARKSTLTAFYTPPVVIRSIYQALQNMGFSQGNILEPACGTGNFLGLLPGSMAASKLYGVELDDVSGRIARQLYQRSSVTIRGFEKVDFPDSFFDAAIGNVPFGQFKVADRRYDRLNLPVHEYFLAKTLDKVRPGGVIAFITSSYTMDTRTSTARKYIAQRAELLGAIRLPNDTFKAAAGTEVVSDILFLQKRDRMVDIEPEWVHLATVGVFSTELNDSVGRGGATEWAK